MAHPGRDRTRQRVPVREGQHAADDGDAERRTEFLHRVVHGGQPSRTLRGPGAHEDVVDRGHGQAHAGAEQHQSHGSGRVSGAGGEEGQYGQARGHGGQAERDGDPGADRLRDSRGQRRGDDDGGGERHGGQPRGHRREVQHQLELLGDHEGPAEQGEHQEGHGAAGPEELPGEHQPQVEHGLLGGRLAQEEERQHHQSAEERDEHGARTPAARRRGDHPEEDAAHAGRGEHGAREVGPARHGVLGLRHDPGDADERQHHDGDVEDEDGAPPEVFQQHAAEQRAEHHAQRGDRAPASDGGAALLGGEDVDQDRQGARHEERSADAHQSAGGDDLPRLLREGAERGGDAEDGQAHQQHLLAPEAVREAAGGEQDTGQHQGVRVHEPLEFLGPGPQFTAHRRQRDVEHRGVDRHHEHGQAQHRQNRPAAWMSLFHFPSGFPSGTPFER